MKKIEKQSIFATSTYTYPDGFTAVELLITLFIAAAFLFSGYQLYGMIIKDGAEARARATASNVAYQYLQLYKTDKTNYIKNPCNQKNIITTSPAIEGLNNVTISGSIACPYAANTSISKITVIIKYNNPQQTLKEITYVNYQ